MVKIFCSVTSTPRGLVELATVAPGYASVVVRLKHYVLSPGAGATPHPSELVEVASIASVETTNRCFEYVVGIIYI